MIKMKLLLAFGFEKSLNFEIQIFSNGNFRSFKIPINEIDRFNRGICIDLFVIRFYRYVKSAIAIAQIFRSRFEIGKSFFDKIKK